MAITDSAGYSNFVCPFCGARVIYLVEYSGLDRAFYVRLKCHGRSYGLTVLPEVLMEAKSELPIRELIEARLKYTIMEEKRAVDRPGSWAEFMNRDEKEPEPEDLMARPIRKIELE
jgi:hypothetical protein